jgi:hypothetical protein
MEIQEVHGNTKSPWKYKKPMEIQEVHGNTRSLWKYKKSMEIQKVHGNTKSPWKYILSIVCVKSTMKKTSPIFRSLLALKHGWRNSELDYEPQISHQKNSEKIKQRRVVLLSKKV